MAAKATEDLRTVKVAQCWDDGVLDDIRVTEILRKYGAKASFNLNAGLHKRNRKLNWRYNDVKDVYKLGLNELPEVYVGFLAANHSFTHQHLDEIPLNKAEAEIIEGRDRLEQIFGYKVTGFAYPFGTYNDEVKELIKDAGHIYARTVVNVPAVFPVENSMEFHPNCHFMDPNFQQIFETAAESGVFYFWGHSYEMVTEKQWHDFEGKIATLSETPGVEWTNLPDLFTG